MAFLIFLLFLAPVLFAWYSVFWLIPGVFRDATMYRLWRLKDDLTDEILRGEYPTAHDEALALRQALIELGQRLEDVSVGKLLLLRQLARGLEFDPLIPAALAAGPEREQLELRVAEVVDLLDRLARRKTPSGWLTTVLPLSALKVKERDLGALLQIARPADEY